TSSLASRFSFTPPATPQLYTLSLHDALPISARSAHRPPREPASRASMRFCGSSCPVNPTARATVIPAPGHGCPNTRSVWRSARRSEEHTSELQSQSNLVCRLLLEKKKTREQQYEVQLDYGRDLRSRLRARE